MLFTSAFPTSLLPLHNSTPRRTHARSSLRCLGMTTPTQSNPVVVGMGSCGMDYLAAVAAFPHPDEKLRTEKLEVQGGGNAANALTAAARLGLRPRLLSIIGDDSLGDAILTELQGDGVDTAHVLRAQNSPSPFTYIIVDQAGGTRTCIHTPGAPYPEGHLDEQIMSKVLQDARLVYFDGRLTESAVELARFARTLGVPVLVEAERLRPNLDLLLAEADHVVASTHFPQNWTGHEELGNAVVANLQRLPGAKWLIVTLGKRGAICVERVSGNEEASAAQESAGIAVAELLHRLQDALRDDAAGAPDCVSNDGRVDLRAGPIVHDDRILRLTIDADAATQEAAAKTAAAAAERAALANADAANALGYLAGGGVNVSEGVTVRLAAVAAADLAQEQVVDTTGAGDAFIGSLLYGLATGLPLVNAMQLGCVVAACKCTALGARPGLPRAGQISQRLLGDSVRTGVQTSSVVV